MLMKVVAAVPIFAAVAASAIPSLAGTRPTSSILHTRTLHSCENARAGSAGKMRFTKQSGSPKHAAPQNKVFTAVRRVRCGLMCIRRSRPPERHNLVGAKDLLPR